MDGLVMAFTPGAAGGATGPAIAGLVAPPITAPTVLTTVPVAVRVASQSANWLKMVGLTDGAGHTLRAPVQMWWKVNCTQLPLFFVSAWVTLFFRSASVQVLSTSSGALV